MQPIKCRKILKDDDVFIDDLLDKVKNADVINIKPSHQVRKHSKETIEQYNLRQANINTQGAVTHNDILVKKNVSLLRSMFSKRKRQKRKFILIKAIFVIRKFMRYCAKIMKLDRQIIASIVINSICRGYLARLKIPSIIEEFMMKLGIKAFSVIKIRNFLRKCARSMLSSPWFKPVEIEGCRGAFIAKIAFLRERKAQGAIKLKVGSSMQKAMLAAATIATDGSKISNSASIIVAQRYPSQDIPGLPGVDKAYSKDKVRSSFSSTFLLGGRDSVGVKQPLSSAASSAARMLGLGSFLNPTQRLGIRLIIIRLICIQ